MQVNTTWLWLLYAVCCVPSVIMWTRDCLRRTPAGGRSNRAIAWADGIMFGIGTGARDQLRRADRVQRHVPAHALAVFGKIRG